MKRIISTVLVLSFVISGVMFAYGSAVVEHSSYFELDQMNYKTLEIEEIDVALEGNANYVIEVNESNRDEIYEKLGIAEFMEEKNLLLPKDATIEDEKFYFENINRSETEEALPDYKGVPMKAVYNSRLVTYDEETLYVEKDLKSSIIESTLSKGISILFGFASPYLWVPDTVLGLTSSWFSSNLTYGTNLKGVVQKGEVGKFIFVKDVDNRISGYDWYAFVSVDLGNYLMTVTLNYMDKNNEPNYIDSNERFTRYTTNYYNNSFLQKEAYGAYKGEPGYTEYSEHLSKPEFDK